MNDDKIRISPDALIAMIVTEAQDRELARMPSLEEMNEDFQPSEKFQRKMEALVRDTKRMPSIYRRTLVLRVKGYSIREIAQITNSSESNVKTRIHRARAILLKSFDT